MSHDQDFFDKAKKVRRAVKAHVVILQRAKDIVMLIKSTIDAQPKLAEIGLVLIPQDGERIISKVVLPMAQARLVLNWRTDQQSFYAFLVAERLSFDRNDQAIWTPVWSLLLPEEADPSVVCRNGEQPIVFDMHFHENHEDSVRRAVISMAFAILHTAANA